MSNSQIPYDIPVFTVDDKSAILRSPVQKKNPWYRFSSLLVQPMLPGGTNDESITNQRIDHKILLDSEKEIIQKINE